MFVWHVIRLYYLIRLLLSQEMVLIVKDNRLVGANRVCSPIPLLIVSVTPTLPHGGYGAWDFFAVSRGSMALDTYLLSTDAARQNELDIGPRRVGSVALRYGLLYQLGQEKCLLADKVTHYASGVGLLVIAT